MLRRPPMGELPAGAYDMAREFRILSRLPDALPFVPRGLHLCDDPSVIGQRFQIIEYRAGLVIRETFPPDLRTPGIGARLSQVLLETIAAIHAVDTAAVGLDDLGRPEGFLARGVSGWRKRGLAAREDGTEALHHEVGAWLEQQPRPGRPARAAAQRFQAQQHHPGPGRFFAARGGGLGPGHPRRPAVRFRHAAVVLGPCRRSAGDARHGADAGGRGCLCSRQEAVAEYARISGRDVSDFLFHRVLAMYKLAVIFLQLGLRYRTGATAEPRYAPLTAIGTGILEFTHEIAQGRAF